MSTADSQKSTRNLLHRGKFKQAFEDKPSNKKGGWTVRKIKEDPAESFCSCIT